MREDGGKTLISGYASVFYNASNPDTQYQLWDDVYERVMPGAFDRALAGGQDVRGLFNHDSNYVLGRSTAGTMRLVVDEIGLRYDIDPPDTQAGRDVVESLKRGDITGSSFAFLIPHGGQRWIEAEGGVDVREITDVDLFDVGPVTFPAYRATTAGLRAEDVSQLLRAEYDEWKGFNTRDSDIVRVGLALAKVS